MDIISVLTIIMIGLIFVIFVLVVVYLMIIVNNKKRTQSETVIEDSNKNSKKTFSGVVTDQESIFKFMDFDEVRDNMIVRKNREQYVMVIQCQGVNYDLMSEEEKIAVEEGFVQFLNTLQFPIQLYVQTRSLNLKEIIEEYKDRVDKIRSEINQFDPQIAVARSKGNQELVEKLLYQQRRKQNVLEYGADISDYVSRLSLNKNVLQQKTYIIVSYFPSEFGGVSNYSKEEMDNICFSELYTRCQSVMRSIATSGVTGKILESEDVTELLYIAYNRDDSELLQLSKALDAEYDALYSTSKDVLVKKQEALEEMLDVEAVNLATESILEADNKRKRKEEKEKKEIIKGKALDLIEEYSEQMDEELYEGAKKQVENFDKPKSKENTNE